MNRLVIITGEVMGDVSRRASCIAQLEQYKREGGCTRVMIFAPFITGEVFRLRGAISMAVNWSETRAVLEDRVLPWVVRELVPLWRGYGCRTDVREEFGLANMVGASEWDKLMARLIRRHRELFVQSLPFQTDESVLIQGPLKRLCDLSHGEEQWSWNEPVEGARGGEVAGVRVYPINLAQRQLVGVSSTEQVLVLPEEMPRVIEAVTRASKLDRVVVVGALKSQRALFSSILGEPWELLELD